jgi:hypothetical protein
MVPQSFEASTRLSTRQAALMVICGVVLWLAAALLLRWLAAAGALDGPLRMFVYLVTIPGTVPFVLALRRIGKLTADQLVPAYSLATAAALLCDGIAVAWFPALYGTSADHVRLAAAAVLWGAGVGIFLAFAVTPRIRLS